jgi:PIN domain nuclease of toxin-antitoxin system
MSLLLDTSALLFWTTDPGRLSPVSRSAIDQADHLYLSSISLWEVGTKQRKGKLTLPGTIREFASFLHQVDRLDILPVDDAIWIASVELEWEHRDPADRVIVATAQHLGARLITSDELIRAFYPRALW